MMTALFMCMTMVGRLVAGGDHHLLVFLSAAAEREVDTISDQVTIISVTMKRRGSSKDVPMNKGKKGGRLLIYTLIGIYIIYNTIYGIWTSFLTGPTINVLSFVYNVFVLSAALMAAWIDYRKLL